MRMSALTKALSAAIAALMALSALPMSTLPLSPASGQAFALDAASEPMEPAPAITSMAANMPEGSYYVRPLSSPSRVLDIAGGSSDQGANLQLYWSNLTSAQQFRLRYDERGYCVIETSFGSVLDVQHGIAASGTNVWQYGYNGSAAQKWLLRGSQQDGYEIVSALAGPEGELCLDVAGAANSDGANLQIYAANGTYAQRFELMPVGAFYGGQRSVPDGIYTLAPALNPGLRLDVQGASDADGAAIQTWDANSSMAQMFAVTWTGRSYKLLSVASGKALDAAQGGIVSYTPVQQYSDNGTVAQEWQIQVRGQAQGGQVVSLVSAGSGLSLDVANGESRPGTRTQLYEPNNTNAQIFTLQAALPAFPGEFYSLAPLLDGSLRADIRDNSNAAAAPAQMFPANFSAAQAFVVEKAGDQYALKASFSGMYLSEEDSRAIVQQPKTASGFSPRQLWSIGLHVGGYALTNAGTGHVLSISGRALAATNATGGDPQAAQLFKLAPTSVLATGSFEIVTPAGNCLDVADGSAANHANVQLYAPNGSQAQKFNLSQTQPGLLGVKNVYSFKMLDVENNTSQDGANIQMYAANGVAGQSYALVPTGDGWYLLRSALGTYVATTGDAPGANVYSTSDRAAAQRFDLLPTQGWTSGLPELDMRLAGVMDGIGRDGDVLRKCYDYVAGFSYREGSKYPEGDWTPGFALEMLNYGSGNCYRYAALLSQLLKYNGYDCAAITGHSEGVNYLLAHSWVELYLNGETFILDAEAAHEIPGRNFYMVKYGQAPLNYVK
jgi:hypothetical protein